jgi:hypothetical protein
MKLHRSQNLKSHNINLCWETAVHRIHNFTLKMEAAWTFNRWCPTTTLHGVPTQKNWTCSFQRASPNVGILPQHYTASQPKRTRLVASSLDLQTSVSYHNTTRRHNPEPEASPPSKPQISQQRSVIPFLWSEGVETSEIREE